MSKIDYTNEYHELLDALTFGTLEEISSAVQAMGLKLKDDNDFLGDLLIDLNNYFFITGPDAENSTCVLRDENATF